nr:hypothetical protein [Tanacetum cinerariifolium]
MLRIPSFLMRNSSRSRAKGLVKCQPVDTQVLDVVSTKSIGTFIITIQWYFVEYKVIVQVLFLVSWQPTWSSFAKAVRAMQESFTYHKSILMDPRRSTVPLVNFWDSRNDESKSYQARGACFNPYVMAISIISVSLDSSENLFGTIPTTIPHTTLSMITPSTHEDTTLIPIVSPTIPPSLDYIPASPDYTPASPDYSPGSNTKSDSSEDPSSYHIPPIPATLPFLSSIDDSSDSDILDTPPSLPMAAYSTWSTVLLPSYWAGTHDDCEEEG